jgi:hypothetical protein
MRTEKQKRKMAIESNAKGIARDVISAGYVVVGWEIGLDPKVYSSIIKCLENKYGIVREPFQEDTDVFFLKSSNKERIMKKVNAEINISAAIAAEIVDRIFGA